MTRPLPFRTPKQTYDLLQQREIAIELLPEGSVKEKVRMDLARLRAYAETLQAPRAVAPRKPVKD